MIQKGKNRGFRPISQISVDSEMAQSVNTFSELNILGSYDFYHMFHTKIIKHGLLVVAVADKVR